MTTSLPYGRQWIHDDDIQAVVDVLKSDRLTTGPRVAEFEEALAEAVGTRHAVAVSSGTAGLHCAMHALGIQPGDEVIVPTLTFAATANCVVFQGATPVFADVDAGTLLIDVRDVERKITDRTRAIIAVDFAGQPADYEALRALCREHDIALVADACHSLGAADQGIPVGQLADLTVFSLHPVKPITAGEGGVVVTCERSHAESIRQFRNHGISQDVNQREHNGVWFYEMTDLGFNYRLTDMQCALAHSQLARLSSWTRRRRELAAHYDQLLQQLPMIRPLSRRKNIDHAYHLYVVQIDGTGRICRDVFFDELRESQIGVQVHYIPVHLHPYYRRRFRTRVGQCPIAERAFRQILSLPLFPAMADEDVDRVVDALNDVVEGKDTKAA